MTAFKQHRTLTAIWHIVLMAMCVLGFSARGAYSLLSSNQLVFVNVDHAALGTYSTFSYGTKSNQCGFGFSSASIPYQSGGGGVIIALSGTNGLQALPFMASTTNISSSATFFADTNVQRTLTPCTDLWNVNNGGLTWTDYTPAWKMPSFNSASLANRQHFFLPATWMVFSIQNTNATDEDFYLGLPVTNTTQMSYASGAYQGFAVGEGAMAVQTGACDLLSGPALTAALNRVTNGFAFHLNIPAGQTKSLTVVLAYYRSAITDTRVSAHYYYTTLFGSMDSVISAAFAQFTDAQTRCQQLASAMAGANLNAYRQFLASHAMHSYMACTRAELDANNNFLWREIEGAYNYINTFDLTVDHSFFDSLMYPWALRNVLDTYSGTFNGSGYIFTHPLYDFVTTNVVSTNGFGFHHDMGTGLPSAAPTVDPTTYEGGYGSYMGQEELQNWILSAGLYWSRTSDNGWLTNNTIMLQTCFNSMLLRDDTNSATRDGNTTYLNRCGSKFEITTYDSLDPSLQSPRLNAMTTMKNWASYLALQAMFQQIGDTNNANTCSNMANLAAQTIVNVWNTYHGTIGFIPAFLDGSNTNALLPIVEGLSYPAQMGLTNAVNRVSGPYAGMLQALSNHVAAVLVSGRCLDSTTGGWKLSSANNNTWQSKIYLGQYIIENILGVTNSNVNGTIDQIHATIQMAECPFQGWSDQLDSSGGSPKGSFHYPRGVTSALWWLNATNNPDFSPPVTVPAAPTGGGVVAITNFASISLSWNASLLATGYIISRSTQSGGPYTSVGSVDAITTSFTDSSVTKGVTYYYVVMATNEVGGSLSSAETIATMASPLSLWWDGGSTNNTGSGSGTSGGGNGTWNTTIQNWDQGSGQTYVAWNNANTNIAVFAGTAGTINITADVMVGGLTLTAADTISSSGPSLIFPAGGIISNTAAVTISASLAGAGAITKTGSSTLTLYNVVNNYAVGTVNQFTGVTLISNGNIKPTWTSYSPGSVFGLQKSVYDTTGSTGGIGLDVSNSVTNLWLGGLAGSVDLATAITSYSTLGALILNPQTGTSATYAGTITNGATGMTLTKNGPGTQTLTGTNLYTGATMINAGTLVLSSASASITNSAATVRGGTLLLDNSGGMWVNRLSDSAALSLGSLILNSYNGAGVQSEMVGATTFAVGGMVAITNGTTAGDQTTLALGAVTRSNGVAINFVGVNGSLGGGANSPNVTSTGAFPGVTNGILPWATVNSTNWAYTNANGIVAYSGVFVDPTTNASATTANAQLTGSGTMNSAKSFNSLNVIASVAGQSFDLSTAGVLTITNGKAILKSGGNAYTISGTAANSITSGTELIAHVDGGDLTISAKLNTAILGLAKGGTGKLILSGTRAGTLSGSVSIANGTLEFQGLTTIISGLMSGAGRLTCNLNSGQFLNIKNTGNNFTGSILIKGGMLTDGDAYNSQGAPGGVCSYGGLANIEISGTNSVATLGVPYFFGRYLGTGSDQIQITGGTSGFSAYGGAPTFTINGSAGYEVMWGSAYFQPTTLVLNDSPANNPFTFQNALNLNGTTRTIAVYSTTQPATISGVILDRIGGAGLMKTGAGTLTLSAANIFNGATMISAGTLALSGTGAITNSASIVVASNAIFNVSGLTSAFKLAQSLGSQSLSNSASGAIINGTNNCSVGTISLVYDGVNPCFVMTNGGMNLSASTAIQINNIGTRLVVGTYTLITNTLAGNAGYVAGTVTNAVTVSGNGVAGTATLSVSSNQLILTVTGGTTTPGNFNGISVSGTALGLVVTNGTPGATWTLLQSTNVAQPVSQWQTNRTGNYDANGRLTTNILNTATNPLEFYLLK